MTADPVGPERERVRPSQLVTAARIADAMVYAAGAAGVLAGGLLFRDGSLGLATVAWALTFVAGAGLRLAAWSARGLAELLVRAERIEDDLARLTAAEARREPPPGIRGRDAPPDPYRRWGGWH